MRQERRVAGTPVIDSGEEVELLHAIRNIKRFPRLFWIVIALSVLAGVLYLVVAKPSYKADALVQIDQQQGSVLGALADVASAFQLGMSSADGELEIIKSRATLYPAIAELNADTEIRVDNRFPILGRLYAQYSRGEGLVEPFWGMSRFAWGGEALRLQSFNVPRSLFEQKFYLNVTSNNSWVLNDANGNILSRGRVGDTVGFTVMDERGKKGQASISIRQIIAHSGTRFLLIKHSSAATFKKISRDFDARQTTRDSSTIAITYEDSDPDFAAQFVNSVAKAYVGLNIEHRAEQARLSLAFLKNKLPEIRLRVDDAETKLNQYRVGSKMIDVDGQTRELLDRAADLAKAQAQAEVAAQSQAQVFQSDAPTMRMQAAQLRALSQQQSMLDSKLKTLPSAQQEFVRLSLDVEVNRSLYKALLENEQQLEVMNASTTGNVFVAEYAESPEFANWPRIQVVLLGSFLFGLVAAFVAVQIRVAMFGAIKDPLDIERVTALPLLAIIPKSDIQEKVRRYALDGTRVAPQLLSRTHSGDRAVEAIRSLRSAIQFLPEVAEKGTILFTGPTPGVGKSFISVNFAYLLAKSGKRVVLVDGDMRRSSIGQYVQVDGKAGLAEVLSGKVSLEGAIHKDQASGLYVLPACADVPKNPSELLESTLFAKLIKSLNAQYDYVVIDAPPVLPVSDSLWIARHVDTVLMVTRAEVSNPRHLLDALSRLANVRVLEVGMILNGFEPRHAGYQYEHGYDRYTSS